MILRKKIGLGLVISGSLVSLGNWLWLVGILPRPDDHLADTRWAYSLIVVLIAVPFLVQPEGM